MARKKIALLPKFCPSGAVFFFSSAFIGKFYDIESLLCDFLSIFVLLFFLFFFCNRRCWWKIHQFYFPPQNPQPSATCMRRLQLTSHRNDPFVHVFFCLICAVSFAYGICNEWKIGQCTHTHTHTLSIHTFLPISQSAWDTTAGREGYHLVWVLRETRARLMVSATRRNCILFYDCGWERLRNIWIFKKAFLNFEANSVAICFISPCLNPQ